MDHVVQVLISVIHSCSRYVFVVYIDSDLSLVILDSKVCMVEAEDQTDWEHVCDQVVNQLGQLQQSGIWLSEANELYKVDADEDVDDAAEDIREAEYWHD